MKAFRTCVFLLLASCFTSIQAQKIVYTIVPKDRAAQSFYEEFITKFMGKNDIKIIEKYKETDDATGIQLFKEIYPLFGDADINQTQMYFEVADPPPDYYLEVAQSKDFDRTYTNTVILYSKTKRTKFEWISKKEVDFNDLLIYHYLKISFFIKNKIKQKDLIIIKYYNGLGENHEFHNDFDQFLDPFLRHLKQQDEEVISQFTFISFTGLEKQLALNIAKKFEIKMEIIVLGEAGSNKLKITLKKTAKTNSEFNHDINDYREGTIENYAKAIAQVYYNNTKVWLTNTLKE